MQLSAKNQNACLAAIELAQRHSNPQPVGLKTIAKEQNISSQFLVQILLQLKRAGLVQSTRGACGGYRLAKDPSEISLLDIITAMDGAVGNDVAPNVTNPAARVFFGVWSQAIDAHRQRLAELTLDLLVANVESQAEDMYYI